MISYEIFIIIATVVVFVLGVINAIGAVVTKDRDSRIGYLGVFAAYIALGVLFITL